jgi:hypothetical protein
MVKLSPRWVTREAGASDFVQIRRMLLRWYRSTTGYRMRLAAPAAGFWLFRRQGEARALADAAFQALHTRGVEP